MLRMQDGGRSQAVRLSALDCCTCCFISRRDQLSLSLHPLFIHSTGKVPKQEISYLCVFLQKNPLGCMIHTTHKVFKNIDNFAEILR